MNKNDHEEQIDFLLQQNHYAKTTNFFIFRYKNDNNTYVCRRSLNPCTDRKQSENRLLRFIEQEKCNITYKHLNSRMNIFDYYVKTDPPMCLAAYFGMLNVPTFTAGEKTTDDNSLDKLFRNKTKGKRF